VCMHVLLYDIVVRMQQIMLMTYILWRCTRKHTSQLYIQWIKIQHDMLEPPMARATPSRPKKLRKMGVDASRDPQNKFRIRRFGARMTCSKCKGKGHNKRACPMSMSQLSQELPTPPPASVSFAIDLIILVVIV